MLSLIILPYSCYHTHQTFSFLVHISHSLILDMDKNTLIFSFSFVQFHMSSYPFRPQINLYYHMPFSIYIFKNVLKFHNIIYKRIIILNNNKIKNIYKCIKNLLFIIYKLNYQYINFDSFNYIQKHYQIVFYCDIIFTNRLNFVGKKI